MKFSLIILAVFFLINACTTIHSSQYEMLESEIRKLQRAYANTNYNIDMKVLELSKLEETVQKNTEDVLKQKNK